MMRTITNTTILFLLIVSIAGLMGCLEDRETEIVLNDENCESFDEYRTSAVYTTPYLLDVAEEIDSLLADNDVSRGDILEAFLVSASYEITDFPHGELYHDWAFAGVIMVERIGSGNPPDTLLDYNDYITVSDAVVGDKTYVVLHEAGVAVINGALDDFITGADPVLRFTIENGDIEPDPSMIDPMIFSWEFCLFIQVLTTLDTEIFQVF
jgi:hypothetical protein